MNIDSDYQVSRNIFYGEMVWYFNEAYRRASLPLSLKEFIKRSPAAKKSNTTA